MSAILLVDETDCFVINVPKSESAIKIPTQDDEFYKFRLYMRESVIVNNERFDIFCPTDISIYSVLEKLVNFLPNTYSQFISVLPPIPKFYHDKPQNLNLTQSKKL